MQSEKEQQKVVPLIPDIPVPVNTVMGIAEILSSRRRELLREAQVIEAQLVDLQNAINAAQQAAKDGGL